MKADNGRKPHFFRAYNEIFDKWGPVLKANGIAVYLCLVRHANNDGTCYPSFSTIAKKCGVSRRTVIRTIEKLVELGLIKRERRNRQGTKEKTSNLYTIVDLSKVSEREVVSQGHHPSVTEALPLVSQGHHPSVTEALEGDLPKETEFEETTTTSAAPKKFSSTDGESCCNSSSNDNCDVNDERAENENAITTSETVTALSDTNDGIELIFDFALKDFTPEQKQRATEMLKSIANADKQLVLDEFNDALSKNIVNSPWAYLSALLRQYEGGNFTPTSNLPEKRAEIIDAKSKKAAIKACRYCDGRGSLSFRVHDGEGNTEVQTYRFCSHNAEKIKNFAIKRSAEIITAEPDYQNSLQLKPPVKLSSSERDQARAILRAMIGGLSR